MEEFKKCNKCLRNLPYTDEYFHYNKATKDGFNTFCKECRGNKFGKSKPRAERKRSKSNLGIIEGKICCNKCERWLLLDENHFFKHSGSLLGYEAICKECKGREFGINRSVIEFKTLDGVECKKCTSCNEFKPNNLDNFARARGENLDSKCRLCINTYQRNSEKIKISSKKYRLKTEFKLIRKTISQRRRSSQNNCTYSLTKTEWLETIIHWSDDDGNIHCAYCNEIITEPDQEHIIPVSKNGGYVKSNIIPVGGTRECACNQSKGKKTLNEFFEYSNYFTKDRYLKIKNFILLHISKEHSENYVFLF